MSSADQGNEEVIFAFRAQQQLQGEKNSDVSVKMKRLLEPTL